MSTAWMTQSARRNSSSIFSTSLVLLVLPNFSSLSTFQISPDWEAVFIASCWAWSVVPVKVAES